MRKLFTLAGIFVAVVLDAQVFNDFPTSYRWIGDNEVAFGFRNGGKGNFSVDVVTGERKDGVDLPADTRQSLPFSPDGAVNLTFSPDSTKMAFTRDNDLWVVDVATRKETRLTSDGSAVILNGYASWVYYEEIYGRASRYRAFWWSPDSRKIGFCRFDNTEVPVFPIYSPFPEDYDRSGMMLSYSQKAGSAVPMEGVSPTGGSVRMTRYPKCGDNNPKVRMGIADAETGKVVWADFNEEDDQYFGTPFWKPDGKVLFVQREPRTQNTLDLYAVSPEDGSKSLVYHESYPTWLDWIDGMVFGRDGLYMVRSFETSWQQAYYLSYDGKTLRRLTSGENWRMSILSVDEGKPSRKFDGSTSRVFFLAQRDSRVRASVCSAFKGKVTTLTDPTFNASAPELSPDRKHLAVTLSNSRTPHRIWIYDLVKPGKSFMVADLAGKEFSADALFGRLGSPEIITMTTHDGFELPALVVYPMDFDPSRKYPVHVDIYGGPDTPMVSDEFLGFPYAWYAANGIIEVVADCRAAGHNGRAGLDMIYRQLSKVEVEDFVEWASYLKGLPYVQADKIGVEGFSFGGTMTALLVMEHSDAFHYGIAGGGVYDWSLYDTHYTERFMDTPANNPEGYSSTRAVAHAGAYPVKESNYDGSVMLKLTHGTGDDNVHFQNTLMLVDALQKAGAKFELMVYPDGMHGYRGYQGSHFEEANHAFWLKYLKGE